MKLLSPFQRLSDKLYNPVMGSVMDDADEEYEYVSVKPEPIDEPTHDSSEGDQDSSGTSRFVMACVVLQAALMTLQAVNVANM